MFSVSQYPGKTQILFDGDPILTFIQEHIIFRYLAVSDLKLRPKGPVEFVSLCGSSFYGFHLLRGDIACRQEDANRVRITLKPTKVENDLLGRVREEREFLIEYRPEHRRFRYTITSHMDFLSDIKGGEGLALTPNAQWGDDNYAVIEFDDPLLAGGVGPQVPMTQDWTGLPEPVFGEDSHTTRWKKRYLSVVLPTAVRGLRKVTFNRMVNGVQHFFNRVLPRTKPHMPFLYEKADGRFLQFTPLYDYPASHHICEWGLDISGTLQGAGGIGGLLAVTKSDGTYFPFADGNGNITEYVDTNGTIVAHYEFDPYGKLIVATGDHTDDFVFLFQTEYLDPETGEYYWKHRYYHPDEGRWLSRDPIGVGVSMNFAIPRGDASSGYLVDEESLYAFVLNDPVNMTDPFGLYTLREASDEWAKTHTCKGLTGKSLAKCQAALWAGHSDKAKFNLWYLVEKADMSWTGELPSCPKTICVVSTWVWTTAKNPDPKKWNDPSKLTLHPKPSVFEMRSLKTPGGHGQQCCYDATGGLVTGGGEAPGNADRAYYKDVFKHIGHDKDPADLATKLGIFDKYLEVRPSDPGAP